MSVSPALHASGSEGVPVTQLLPTLYEELRQTELAGASLSGAHCRELPSQRPASWKPGGQGVSQEAAGQLLKQPLSVVLTIPRAITPSCINCDVDVWATLRVSWLDCKTTPNDVPTFATRRHTKNETRGQRAMRASARGCSVLISNVEVRYWCRRAARTTLLETSARNQMA